MFTDLLKPPWLYLMIIFIVLLLATVYWKRKLVTKEIKRWRLKEINLWALTFGRVLNKGRKVVRKSTVMIGDRSEIKGANIKDIVGGDRGEGVIRSTKGGRNTQVVIGKGGKIENTDIEHITGGDANRGD